MHDKLFESALGINAPWSVKSVEFDAAAKRLTVLIDFAPGTRFPVAGIAGVRRPSPGKFWQLQGE